MDTPFEGVFRSSIEFADVDNDEDLDLFISGFTDDEKSFAKLYHNDGLGNFTESVNTPFEPGGACSSKFADIDNDGDPDLLITGGTSSSNIFTKLYTNDGAGNFTEIFN